eukprot:2167018-Rhodomonas_salina.1
MAGPPDGDPPREDQLLLRESHQPPHHAKPGTDIASSGMSGTDIACAAPRSRPTASTTTPSWSAPLPPTRVLCGVRPLFCPVLTLNMVLRVWCAVCGAEWGRARCWQECDGVGRSLSVRWCGTKPERVCIAKALSGWTSCSSDRGHCSSQATRRLRTVPSVPTAPAMLPTSRYNRAAGLRACYALADCAGRVPCLWYPVVT